MSTGSHRRPSSRRRARTLTIAAITASALLASAGGAAALWRANGSGTGSAKAGSQGSISFTTKAAVAAGFLYPNGPAVGLAVEVNRLAGQTFTVQTMARDTSRSITVTGIANPALCPGSNITVSPKTGLGQAIPSGSGAVAFTIASAVTISATAPSACQGAIFEIPIIMTGTV